MWCVVHVRDKDEENAEALVAGLLSGSLNTRCFHLIRNRRKKYEGKWRTVGEELFPGYVFIETDRPEIVHRELKRASGPKLLFSDDGYVSTLEQRESDFMEMIADKDGVIPISNVRVKDDGTVECLSGPLVHVKNRIKKINLHKRVAEVEVRLLGRRRTLYLGIEIEGLKG